jgi:hypothetical protein
MGKPPVDRLEWLVAQAGWYRLVLKLAHGAFLAHFHSAAQHIHHA